MRGQSGFTMVELIIATAAFSFILIIITSGFIQVNRIYQSGVIHKDSLRNGREIFEQMSRDFRHSKGFVVENLTINAKEAKCLTIGSNRYFWYFDNAASAGDPLSDVGRWVLRRVHAPESSSGKHCVVSDIERRSTLMIDRGKIEIYKFNVEPIYGSNSDSIPRSLDIKMVIGVESDEKFVDRNAEKCNTGSSIRLCSVLTLHTSLTGRGDI